MTDYLVVRGHLVEDGDKVLLNGDDAKTYQLAGMPNGFRSNQQVEVLLVRAQVAFASEHETFGVLNARAMGDRERPDTRDRIEAQRDAALVEASGLDTASYSVKRLLECVKEVREGRSPSERVERAEKCLKDVFDRWDHDFRELIREFQREPGRDR